jgi:thiol-disulfide isomerase/thioredoxin
VWGRLGLAGLLLWGAALPGAASAQTGDTVLQTSAAPARLPIEGNLPAFDGATQWLNSPPLTPAALRGKVVLVDFWTYTCINWLRTLPYVRGWAAKYKDQGLVVIGVHTPEFGFEKDIGNVRRETAAMQVDYPVAVDSDYAIWRAFKNHYWPALYFVDAQGRIRHHQFGEGDYAQSEKIIQQLLAEAGNTGVSQDVLSVDASGFEAPADWNSLRSPESYLGYDRAENSLINPIHDAPRTYKLPDRLSLNRWALSGTWTTTAQAIASSEAGARIAYRFHARDLHLVLAPPSEGHPVRFHVTVDGASPGADHGIDVDADGLGKVDQPRLYQLIRQSGAVTDRTFEIEFLDPGIRAYVFTFG